MSSKRYPPELRERAVRMVLEHRGEYASEPAAINAIAPKIGCHPDTLRIWLRQHQGYSGQAAASNPSINSENLRIKELERENRELRRSNDILRQASAYSAQAELDRHWKK